MRYCRYADDFALGIIGTKKEAEQIKLKVVEFLNNQLSLQIAKEKTKVEWANKGILFLSYHISTWRSHKVMRLTMGTTHMTKRTVTEAIKLRVSKQRVVKFCHQHKYGDWDKTQSKHRAELLTGTDEEIILTYNAELRGLANYYALADDVKRKLARLQYLAHYSLFTTLAAKHRTKLTTIIQRLKSGGEYIHQYIAKGEVKPIGIFQLKHLDKKPKSWEVDELPITLHLTIDQSELIRRMYVDECEYCGKQTAECEVHHVKS